MEAFGLLDEGRIAVQGGELFSMPVPTEQSLDLDAVRLLAPVRPGKVVGLWNNFHELATKLGVIVGRRCWG